jgi:hypothetical protein
LVVSRRMLGAKTTPVIHDVLEDQAEGRVVAEVEGKGGSMVRVGGGGASAGRRWDVLSCCRHEGQKKMQDRYNELETKVIRHEDTEGPQYRESDSKRAQQLV